MYDAAAAAESVVVNSNNNNFLVIDCFRKPIAATMSS